MLSSDLFPGIYDADISVCDLCFHFLNSVFCGEEMIFMKSQIITFSSYVVFVLSICFALCKVTKLSLFAIEVV